MRNNRLRQRGGQSILEYLVITAVVALAISFVAGKMKTETTLGIQSGGSRMSKAAEVMTEQVTIQLLSPQ